MVKELNLRGICGVYAVSGRDRRWQRFVPAFYIGESANIYSRLSPGHQWARKIADKRAFLLHEWPAGADKKTRLHKENRFVQAAVKLGLRLVNYQELRIATPINGNFDEEVAILNDVRALLKEKP